MATAKADAHPHLLAARESFTAERGGQIIEVKAGDLVKADDELAKKYPALFREPPVLFGAG